MWSMINVLTIGMVSARRALRRAAPTCGLCRAGAVLALMIAAARPAHAQEIILRDGLGDPPTAGGVTAWTGWNEEQNPPVATFPIIVLQTPVDMRLNQLVFATGRITISGNIGAMRYYLRIWPTLEDAVQNKMLGTMWNVPLIPTRVESFGTLSNGRARHLVTFDLAAHEIDLPAGLTFVFNLAIVTPHSREGAWGYVEAVTDLIPGPADYGIGSAIPPPGYASLCPGLMCAHTGKAAFRLTAVPLASCAADLNGDGFVDDADFVLFANAYNALLCP